MIRALSPIDVTLFSSQPSPVVQPGSPEIRIVQSDAVTLAQQFLDHDALDHLPAIDADASGIGLGQTV